MSPLKRQSPREKVKDPDLSTNNKKDQPTPVDPADEARDKKMLWPESDSATERNREALDKKNEKW